MKKTKHTLSGAEKTWRKLNSTIPKKKTLGDLLRDAMDKHERD